MGQFINLLVIAAIVSVGVSFADATSHASDTSDQYYDDSECSSEEDDYYEYYQPKQCKKNEVFACPVGSCHPKTCEEVGVRQPCSDIPKPCPVEHTCICIKSLVRNSTGVCVPPIECPSCGGDNNARAGCGNNCGKTCSDVGKKPPFKCPPCKEYGCECKNGFYYDANRRRCVRPTECTEQCKKNEIYACPVGSCRPSTCEEVGTPLTCSSVPAPCPVKVKCICPRSLVRNSKGVCVPPIECPSCGGDENAQAGCGNNCGKKCSDVGKKPPFKCPPGCQANGCDCKDGFYYDANKKKCVRPKECTPTCRANEVYSTCANGGCGKRKCTDLDKPDICIDPRVCKPGCVCASGFYRDAKGNCVTEKECISQIGCGGDINAVLGCGVNCGKKCRDYGLGPFECGKVFCKVAGCDCKDGFYYDEFQKKCVRPGQCTKPPKCKKNEILSYCANNWCGWRKCTELNGPQMCTDSVGCEPGCICADGYYRDDNNNCITKEQCQIKSTPVTPTNGTSCENATDFEVHLRQGNYILNGKLLYQIMKLNPKKSVVCSAVSTMTSLALLLLYSKDDTYTELLKALNVQNTDEIRCAFKLFLDSIKAAEGTELDLAAKVYIKDSYQLSEPFKKDAKEIFNAEGESISFDNPDNAATTINQWVSGATKGKINDLVTAEIFDLLTRFVIANAIYFKGTWKTEFDPNDTKKADFFVDNQNTKQVDMMERKAKLNYNEHSDLDAQTVELPFQDEDITFVIIVPNQNDGIMDLVDKLQDGATLDRAVSSFRTEVVDLFMPRLDISTSTDLIKALLPIGVKTIFTQNAKLVGTIVPDEDLYVSAAVQKATITLDEKGAEASAANAIVVSQKSLPLLVRADHPFVFGIKVRKTLIFTGIYSG